MGLSVYKRWHLRGTINAGRLGLTRRVGGPNPFVIIGCRMEGDSENKVDETGATTSSEASTVPSSSRDKGGNHTTEELFIEDDKGRFGCDSLHKNPGILEEGGARAITNSFAKTRASSGGLERGSGGDATWGGLEGFGTLVQGAVLFSIELDPGNINIIE